MENKRNSVIEKTIKDLNTLSYLLHLKKLCLPTNEFLLAVDSGRYFSLIHQNIEQLIGQLEQQHSDDSISNMFLPDFLMKTNNDYLEILDSILMTLIQDYKQVERWSNKQADQLLEGLCLNQKRSIQMMNDEITEKKRDYFNNTSRKKNIYKRKNEPFDSEAILNDIL